MGDLEPAYLPGIGPGKCPLLPSEQFALNQISRQGSTVDGDQRPILARAHVMDGGGDQLLSRTGLTEDEDRCVRRSDLLRSIKNILESITFPKNMVEVMFHFDLLTKVNILGLESVFQCFDFRKSRPKFDRLSFQFVMRFF